MKKFALALAALAVLAALLGINWYQDNRLPNITGNTSFYVYPGDTPEMVLKTLDEKGVVKDIDRLSKVFGTKKVAEYITPGYYYVNKGNTSVYVARMLNNGWQSPVNLTFSGTMRRPSDVARRIGNQMLADSLSVLECMQDKAFLDSLGYTPSDVLSLIIPDTYQVYWTATPREILRRMKTVNDEFWTEERLAKAAALGLSRKKVATLASIVTAESTYAPEMPHIAGVYLNRLKVGMLLQADPTVAFCFNYEPERILNKHLEVDSPYNTYKYAGLPPGPICVPSKESLEAVLDPVYGGNAKTAGAPGCDYYFCANPDLSGTHVFASSLSQHNANARAFQEELTRRHRAKLQKK